MNILKNLIAIPICIVITVIDVLFFLTFLRIISYRWHPHWLIALNSKVKPAVDLFSEYVEKVLMYFFRKIYPEKIILFIGMLVLMFIRFMLTALLS